MPESIDIEKFVIELNEICNEKKWNNFVREILQKWFMHILIGYDEKNNILDHFCLREYIENNFEKLRQIESLNVVNLEEILNNPNSLFYKYITKIPDYVKNVENRIAKRNERFVLDNLGEYYLEACGQCIGNRKIELVNERNIEYTFEHELQHINQNYYYPSEFPFAREMIKMLHEGDAEYHSVLLGQGFPIIPENIEDSYEVYYLLYTLLMIAVPKEMRHFWSKTKCDSNRDSLFKIFGFISDNPETRNNFAQIFALVTLMVASCNSENTRDVYEISINKSSNRCLKKVEKWNQMIQEIKEKDKKDNFERMQEYAFLVKELTKTIQSPYLLKKEYLTEMNTAKEWIEEQPKEEQEKYMQEMRTFTIEKYKESKMEEAKELQEAILKVQNKKELNLKEILEEKEYQQYNYYRFGIKLNENMKNLLKQELSFLELFEKFVEAIENYLIQNKGEGLEEKLAFIERVKKENLESSKKI